MAPRERFAQRKKPKDTRGTLLRIARYLSGYLWVVLLLVILSFLSNLGNLMGPHFAGKAIDAAEKGYLQGVGMVDMDVVIHYAVLMAVFYVGSNLLNFLVNLGMMRVGRRVAQTMRRDVFEKLMKLPVSFFDRNQAGDIISRVSYDVDVVCTSLSTDVIHVIVSLVTVVGSFVMMVVISPPLVLCMVFTIPASILFTRYMGKKARPLYARRSAAYNTATLDYFLTAIIGTNSSNMAQNYRLCIHLRSLFKGK